MPLFPLSVGGVTSVALSAPSSILTVSGSPGTGAVSLGLTLATQNANKVWAGPTTGADAVPTFRALVTADLPAGTGTVTSVALTVPSILSVSGSPITTSGTLAVTLTNQSANLVFAGPTTGAAATPTFRALIAGDIPDLSATYQPLNAKLASISALANASGWLHNDGSGVFAYSTPTKSDVGLSNVENTALSTWAGSTNLTTLGTIATGTWNATAVAATKGGTGLTSYTLGDTIYASAANTLAALAGNTTSTRKFLRQTGTGSASAAPAWDTLLAADIPSLSATYALTGATTGSGLTMSTARILGRTTASTGAIEEIGVGSSLSLSAGSLNAIQDIRTSASPTFVGLNTTGACNFGTANGTAAVIDGGASSTGQKYFYCLNSSGDNQFGIFPDGTGFIGNNFNKSLQFYTNGSNRLNVSGSGALQFLAYGAGTLTTDASGNVTASSDERLKDIKDLVRYGLKEVLKINPISYKWNKSSGYETENIYLGFSAQNVKSVIPEAVGIDSNGFYTLQDRAIIASIVNAIHELSSRIDR